MLFCYSYYIIKYCWKSISFKLCILGVFIRNTLFVTIVFSSFQSFKQPIRILKVPHLTSRFSPGYTRYETLFKDGRQNPGMLYWKHFYSELSSFTTWQPRIPNYHFQTQHSQFFLHVRNRFSHIWPSWIQRVCEDGKYVR